MKRVCVWERVYVYKSERWSSEYNFAYISTLVKYRLAYIHLVPIKLVRCVVCRLLSFTGKLMKIPFCQHGLNQFIAFKLCNFCFLQIITHHMTSFLKHLSWIKLRSSDSYSNCTTTFCSDCLNDFISLRFWHYPFRTQTHTTNKFGIPK